MLTPSRLRWVSLLLLTLLIRGLVLYFMFGKLADDPDGYRELAENLAREGVYGYGQPGDDIQPTAYRPVLYPLLLSTAVDAKWQLSLWRVTLMHLALGVGTVLLTLNLGERLKLGGWSYFAALLVCCDPILLNQSALVMTETLATFLAVLSLWCLTRLTQFPEWWNALMAGGALGLSALCRPTFLPWIGLVAIALMLLAKVSWSRRAVHATALIAGACLFLLPWGIRNRVELGKFMLTTTHGGYTFYLGNCHEFFVHLTAGKSLETYDSLEALIMSTIRANSSGNIFIVSGDELLVDHQLYQQSFQDIHEEPHLFAYACLYRLYQLINPLPHPPAKELGPESVPRKLLRNVVAAWYVAVYLLAILGCIRLRKDFRSPPWLWGVLLVFTFLAIHTFYWTNLRMRAPLMPFIALVAAAGSLHVAEPLAHASLLRRKKLKAC